MELLVQRTLFLLTYHKESAISIMKYHTLQRKWFMGNVWKYTFISCPKRLTSIFSSYIIVAFLSLLCIATFSHILMYYHKKNDKMPSNILTEIMLSLSVVRSTSKFLTINNSSDLNLNCICGIKFLSMLLIIAAHSLLFLTGGPIVNEAFLKEVWHSPKWRLTM